MGKNIDFCSLCVVQSIICGYHRILEEQGRKHNGAFVLYDQAAIRLLQSHISGISEELRAAANIIFARQICSTGHGHGLPTVFWHLLDRAVCPDAGKAGKKLDL
jgi:hypothetical protein